MKKCPNCGAQMSDDSLFCTECGNSIPQGNVCPHCGAAMNNGDAFCQNCGKRPDEVVAQIVASSPQKVCPHCGTTMNAEDVFCQNCGKRPDEPIHYEPDFYAKTESPVNWKKILTIVLCVILVAGLSVGCYFIYSDYAEKKAKEEARLKLEKEKQEEQLRLAEKETVDWERATAEGTEKGYQRYLEEHADGLHASEAREKLSNIEMQKLTDEEAYDVRTTIESFFNNIANGEEEDMLRCISPTMDSFLGKANATKVDAISYMRRIHADDVYSVNISLDNSDIQVSKSLGDDERPVYSAEFSYDQRLEREDTSRETFTSMKGNAVLNENYKITSLTLRKMSGY